MGLARTYNVSAAREDSEELVGLLSGISGRETLILSNNGDHASLSDKRSNSIRPSKYEDSVYSYQITFCPRAMPSVHDIFVHDLPHTIF